MQKLDEWLAELRYYVDDWNKNPRGVQFIGATPFPRFVLSEEATSWDDFQKWLEELQGTWCFRGQRESEWLLTTSLDRQVEEHSFASHDGITVESHWHRDRNVEERKNFSRFYRRLDEHNLPDTPTENDLGSCFAQMQHYGTPTRFLDWTTSPFIASYFAFEETPETSQSAVWAIDLDWIEERSRELLRGPWPTDANASTLDWGANNLLRGCDEPVIIRIEPGVRNQRMITQRGVLLCKLRHDVHFTLSLTMMMMHPQLIDRPVVRKLQLPSSLRENFLNRLKEAGIDRQSLFSDECSAGRSA